MLRTIYYGSAGPLAAITRVGLTMCFVVLGGACSNENLRLYQEQLTTKSDSQLIDDLVSGKIGTSQEIVSRGKRMIPLLVKLEGDQRQYSASELGHHLSATAVTSSDPYVKPGVTITVEVAALYLICAIYHDDLEFAQSPYLTDLTIPAAKRKAINSPTLVARAWESADEWNKRLSSATIEDLRLRKDDPLRGSGVAFW